MKTAGLQVRHVSDPAPEEAAFRFSDGSRAASLEEFHARLQSAPADLVAHHRDHYEAWVRDIIRDEPLALRIGAYAEARPEPTTLRDILLDLVGRRLDDWRAASSNR